MTARRHNAVALCPSSLSNLAFVLAPGTAGLPKAAARRRAPFRGSERGYPLLLGRGDLGRPPGLALVVAPPLLRKKRTANSELR